MTKIIIWLLAYIKLHEKTITYLFEKIKNINQGFTYVVDRNPIYLLTQQ